MKTWADLSEQEIAEWQRQEVTHAAIDFLQKIRDLSRAGTVSHAESGTIEEIRFHAGYTRGIGAAIDGLTKVKK